MALSRRLLTLLTCVALAVTPWSPAAARADDPTMTVSNLTTENAENPLGIDAPRPALGWKLSTASRGEQQTAYQVQVWTGNDTPVWDSGRVASSTPFGIAYAGPELTTATRYQWRVRVWDAAGRPSAWSAPAWWETALLHDADWAGAKWIGGPNSTGLPRWPAGSTVTASSTHGRSGTTYDTGNAIDGIASSFWNDDTEGVFPDWLAVRTTSAVSLPGVTLYSAGEGGPRDFTVQTWQDGQWVTQRRVTGVSRAYTAIAFDAPVSTTGVRINVDADWEQDTSHLWTRIGELNPGLVDPVRYENLPAPLLRTTFKVDKPVRQARLSISGLAYYQAYLNGRRVGTAELDPGFTNYDRRVLYTTHDVTNLITQDANAIGVELGRGFFGLTGITPWWGWNRASWHHEPQLKAKLVVTYTDGTSNVVTTGDDWRTSSGPRLFDSVYTGETYDARLAQPGWTQPSFDAGRWKAAEVVDAPAGALQAQNVDPVSVAETIPPVALSHPTANSYVFDFGRTTAGWAQLNNVVGAAGTKVTMQYGELVAPNGTVIDAGNYAGRAVAASSYTLAGTGPESWEPAFSWQSFRYVQVTGLPTAPTLATLLGKAVHTPAAQVGTFRSSVPLHNQIHDAAVRTVRNNMQSILSDTPTWEKNGWIDDAALGSQFIGLSLDVHRFMAKWSTDMRDTQVPSGKVTLVAPSNGHGLDIDFPWGPAPEWQAGYPATVWSLYQQYGDTRVLHENYDALVRYADYELGALDERGLARSSLGDWAPPEATSDPQVTATAFAYRSVRVLAGIAAAVDQPADAARFNAAADRLRDAFNGVFYRPASKVYQSPAEPAYRQTTNAIALATGLVPDAVAGAVADSLAADVARRGDHLATGSIGTSALMAALSRNGHSETAARLASQTTYPSWGNFFANGGDTLFESWDPQVRSRNHLYLGAGIEQWFYEDLAGLRRDGPGWQHLVVAPVLPTGITFAQASIDTVRGTAASSWQRDANGSVRLDVTVPVGATAEVHVPTSTPSAVTESGGPAGVAAGVHSDGSVDGAAVFTVGSGTYHFAAPR